jgi:hypothetical protein
MELASNQPSVTANFEVVLRNLENMCTFGFRKIMKQN